MNAGFELIKREKDFDFECKRKEKALENRRVELENLKESLDKYEIFKYLVDKV